MYRSPQDYPAVRALWEAMEKGIGIGRSDAPGEVAKKAAHDPELFLVAEAEGQIVGTVIAGYDGRRGLVYHLAVAHAYRKQGLATRLMDEIEERLRQRGCLKCYLLVFQGNDEAAEFYQKRGWEHMHMVRLFGKDLAR